MPKATFSSSIFNGATWYLLEKLTRLVGAFLIGAWVARYLGPESYGSLAYALALVSSLGFLGSWGLESLVVRDLVHKNIEPRQIISTYFFIRLGGSLFVPLLAVGYLAITHADDQLLMVMAVICSGSVIFGAFDAADCWLQAKHKASVTSSIRLIGFLVGALIKYLLIISEASIVWFAIAVLVEAGVMAALYYGLLWRHELAPSSIQWSFVEFKRIFVGGKMMVLSALMVAIYSKIDVLVIGALLSKEILAPYTIAASMCAAWNMVGISLVQAWASRVSLAISKSQEDYIGELRNLLLIMFGLSVTGSIFLSALSGRIFDLLLGEEYALGVPIFNVLIWSSVFVFCGVATSQIIVNERIYWVSLFRTFVGVVFSLVFIIPTVSYLGVIGVAGLVVFSSATATLSIFFSASARSTLKKVVYPGQGLKI